MIDQYPLWMSPPVGGSGAGATEKEIKKPKPKVTLYQDVSSTPVKNDITITVKEIEDE